MRSNTLQPVANGAKRGWYLKVLVQLNADAGEEVLLWRAPFCCACVLNAVRFQRQFSHYLSTRFSVVTLTITIMVTEGNAYNVF